MKTYEKYKPSGIDWIGEVPEHWEIKKVSWLFSIGSGTTPSTSNKEYYAEEGINWLQTGDLNDGVIRETSKKITQKALDDCRLTVYPSNSLVVAMYGATIGKVGLLGVETTTNQACCVLYNSKVNTQFAYYTFLADKTNLITESYGGGQPNISQEKIKSQRIACPPLGEQEAIAAYLDARCADIDKVVATQQKRIALLQELKQSEITQAVTRGLNPDARMKDSGVEWIGMVPEDWEVKKLKHVSTAILKGNGITKEQVFEDGDTPCVRYGELYTKYNHSFTECVSATNKDALTVLQYFDHGDLLFTCTGELVEEIGKSIVYLGNERCLAGGDILILKHTQNPAFLNYASNSYGQIQKSCGRAKLKVVHISTYDISSLLLALPSLAEQAEIVEYLDRRCGEIDKQIGAVTRQIELLREYKQALITEVVTGKRKV